MELTPATLSDIPKLRSLHTANWRQDYRGLLPDAALQAPLEAYMDAKWDAEALSRQSVVAAREAEGLIGFAVFAIDGDAGLFLDNLHVARRARGKGAGRSLMRYLAKQAGQRPVFLYVLDGNDAARRIYAAWGGQEGDPIKVPFLDGFVLERRVSWTCGADLLRRLSPPE